MAQPKESYAWNLIALTHTRNVFFLMPTKDREIIMLEPVTQDNPRFPHGLATLLHDVPRLISVHEEQSGPSKTIPAGIKHSIMKIADLGLSPVWHET